VLRLAPVGGVLRIMFANAPPWPYLMTPAGTRLPIRLLLAPQYGEPSQAELIPGGYALTLTAGAYVLCRTGEATDCRNVQVAPLAEERVNFAEPS
jgi:hypothetical protein